MRHLGPYKPSWWHLTAQKPISYGMDKKQKACHNHNYSGKQLIARLFKEENNQNVQMKIYPIASCEPIHD